MPIPPVQPVLLVPLVLENKAARSKSGPTSADERRLEVNGAARRRIRGLEARALRRCAAGRRIATARIRGEALGFAVYFASATRLPAKPTP